jgi:hypothetical protein
MAILVLLSSIGLVYLHFVYFVVIWYIFLHFGVVEQEKSGNPDPKSHYDMPQNLLF